MTTKGRIKQSLSGYYDVLVEDKEYRTRARGNFRKKKMTPVVGDWVDFKIDDNGDGYILNIYPRKNQLVRPPIANIDTAIVVSACVFGVCRARFFSKFIRQTVSNVRK